MERIRRIAILGSTGSIGTSTLEVVAAHPGAFEIVALAAGDNVDRLAAQVRRFRPRLVSLRTEAAAVRLRELLGGEAPEIAHGDAGVARVATHPDAELIVAAIVGAAGLPPTWEAIQAGKDVALANKETLVMAGALIVPAVRERGVRLLPVDSEHAAILQSLEGHRREDVRRIVLTASGGPLRTWEPERIAKATAREALAHPTWNMGWKITIDSATLMNKGLEVIEAHWLFDVPAERIDVVVHPESIVHSMVEYQDGQVIAQLGVPDMKGPIAYALTHPARLPDVVSRLDLTRLNGLHFLPVDRAKFPCLDLAYQALARGGLAPAILNAANEVAVAAFHDGRIGFYDVSRTISQVLKLVDGGAIAALADVLAADRRARDAAAAVIDELAKERN